MSYRIALIMALVLVVSVWPASAQTSTKLEVGKSIEKTLGPGQSHTYTIVLTEKQYLQFVVLQHGIDVMVQVMSPSGQSLARIDSPNGVEGPEHGSILSVAGGTYTITVAPLDSGQEDASPISPGRYEIKTIELRDATEEELKVGMGEEYRKKKALALLDEVVASIPNVRQAQSRVRFKEQAAQLLWKTDEKQAVKLLTECIRDAQEYAASFPLDAEDYYEGFAFAQAVRMEVVTIVATHDPEAALELLIATRKTSGSTGEEFSRAYEETQFELSLAGQIAAKNPQRAFELAETSLKTGYSPTLFQTIIQLRKKNPDLAAKLSKSLTNKLLGEKFLENSQAIEMLLVLLRSARPGKADSAPIAESLQILSPEDTRALVQKALNEALQFKPSVTEPMYGQRMSAQMMIYSLRSIPDLNIDEIVPGSTAAIDKKNAELGIGMPSPGGEWSKYEAALNGDSPETALETIDEAPDYMREQLVRSLIQKTATSGNISQARTIVNSKLKDPRERQRMLNDLERQAAIADANKGDMDGALRHVAKLSNVTARAEVISEIAGRIGQGQNATTALRLLETAKSLLNPSIRSENSEQMTALLRLAGAFSRYDSKRALEIVEPIIEHFNELAEAARTLNGFGADFFQNGELVMSDGNGLSGVASPIGTTLGEISIIDFDKAKQIAERIRLPEVRLAMYLGIAQQVLAPGENLLQTNIYMRRGVIE
jgi:tetratricopeptide (TPR) repeat protein